MQFKNASSAFFCTWTPSLVVSRLRETTCSIRKPRPLREQGFLKSRFTTTCSHLLSQKSWKIPPTGVVFQRLAGSTGVKLNFNIASTRSVYGSTLYGMNPVWEKCPGHCSLGCSYGLVTTILQNSLGRQQKMIDVGAYVSETIIPVRNSAASSSRDNCKCQLCLAIRA